MTPRKATGRRQAPAARYRTLALEARAVAASPRASGMIDRATAQAWLGGVTHQTLLNYVARGLPAERVGPRIRFFGPDLVLCAAYYEPWKREHRGQVTGTVSIDSAREWHLWRQYRSREEPAGFVLVPMAWDHPLRERQLRLAAAGRKPVDPTPNDED
jgi:hypothetical protein